ncbi:MAG: DUF3488 domain-containing transglutaminase family protein [Methylophilaceae bacterium]|nr:DUF3488 domain-containing transglutaminase family protein [Methylophilaceae bacterium]
MGLFSTTNKVSVRKPVVIMQRHHLQWLLLSLAWVLALHATHLPIWVNVSVIAAAVWRYHIEITGKKLPKIYLTIPLTMLAGLGIIFTFRTLFGRDASLALLVIMLGLKLLETRTMRDYVLVILLSYFLVANAFLFSQSLLTLAFTLPPLICITATLISMSHRHSQLSWQFLLKLSGGLLLQAIPVMLILFVLFPRIPGPLWGIPEDSYSDMTGLNDSLNFGNISNLTKNSAIAFRVEFKNKIPPQNQLYWRGPVLWHQNGSQWLVSSQHIGLPKEKLVTNGDAISYSITLEPHNRTWLLMLDMPSVIPNNPELNPTLTHDYQVITSQNVHTRTRYNGISHSQYRLGNAQLSEVERNMALQLNEFENPKTKALAQSWVDQQLTPKLIVETALNQYRSHPFRYTLSPPRLGVNSMDEFLFNTRQGFCEHYATSFVYLMRAAGVPARIVTGYQGGELNPNGHYLIVRQSDAHAWAEVWLDEQGWVRIDPTAAVSPARIDENVASALNDTTELPMMARQDYKLLRSIYLRWDTVNNGWNQWVLGYNEQKQFELLSKLMGKKYSLQYLILWMMGSIAAVMLVISYFLLKTTKTLSSPNQKHYNRYLAKLKKLGLIPLATEGAQDFANRAAVALPSQAQSILEIGEIYNSLRYSQNLSSKKSSAGKSTRMKQLIKAFKPNK